MTTTVRAIYENGVLRPDRPLPLADGEAVDVTVAKAVPTQLLVDEDEVLQRMQEAKSLGELFALYETLPPPSDGYDLCQALNANRRTAGEEPIYPELDAEVRT